MERWKEKVVKSGAEQKINKQYKLVLYDYIICETLIKLKIIQKCNNLLVDF